ncbi:MAG: hypothetical protein M1834_008356 [Cirrosporium novae-zelandiae]|nr:MAG: hypothetical protein M1834_008356 [Cirrosporium novae-zelandiae]
MSTLTTINGLQCTRVRRAANTTFSSINASGIGLSSTLAAGTSTAVKAATSSGNELNTNASPTSGASTTASSIATSTQIELKPTQTPVAALGSSADSSTAKDTSQTLIPSLSIITATTTTYESQPTHDPNHDSNDSSSTSTPTPGSGSSDSGSSNTARNVGISVATIVCIVLISVIFAIFFYRRKYKKRPFPLEDSKLRDPSLESPPLDDIPDGPHGSFFSGLSSKLHLSAFALSTFLAAKMAAAREKLSAFTSPRESMSFFPPEYPPEYPSMSSSQNTVRGIGVNSGAPEQTTPSFPATWRPKPLNEALIQSPPIQSPPVQSPPPQIVADDYDETNNNPFRNPSPKSPIRRPSTVILPSPRISTNPFGDQTSLSPSSSNTLFYLHSRKSSSVIVLPSNISYRDQRSVSSFSPRDADRRFSQKSREDVWRDSDKVKERESDYSTRRDTLATSTRSDPFDLVEPPSPSHGGSWTGARRTMSSGVTGWTDDDHHTI